MRNKGKFGALRAPNFSLFRNQIVPLKVYNNFLITSPLKYNFKIPKNTDSNLRTKTDIYKTENFLK